MSIINVRKTKLKERGISDFMEWKSRPNTVYIGRNMSFYVKGTYKSKWANPYSVKKYGREEALRLYEDHIRNDLALYNSLSELRDKELGCWCYPDPCHGNILLKLLKEKDNLSANTI